MVALPLEDTAAACAANVAVDDVAVTELGTVSAPLLLDSATTAPPVGIVPESETVQVTEAGPVTLDDAQLKDVSVGSGAGGAAFSVSVKLTVAPRYAAVTFAVVLELTAEPEAAKVALVDPAGTVIDPGTLRTAFPDVRATEAPLPGAAPLRFTVQVVDPGVVIADGLQLTEVRVAAGGAGFRVSAKVTEAPE